MIRQRSRGARHPPLPGRGSENLACAIIRNIDRAKQGAMGAEVGIQTFGERVLPLIDYRKN